MTGPRVTARDEFFGRALRMAPDDWQRAAQRIGCEPAAIRAVAEQESGGGSGFLADGRPKILFEALHFGDATGHKWDRSHPNVSSSVWDRALYRGGSAEYDRLHEAIALNRSAALEAASWGKFQILGSNYSDAGFGKVETYVAAMCESEGRQLDAFVAFVTKNFRMTRALREKDWSMFALLYNGRSYKKNRYDTSMATLYYRFSHDSTMRAH